MEDKAQKQAIYYKPLYQSTQIVTGSGTIAIVTGWTKKESVVSKFQKKDYAVIGQLYSPTRGINFLIRNLLYNPHVNAIIIMIASTADDNAGASRCLHDFFKFGFKEGISDAGKKCWIINSDFLGYIDYEIPEDILEEYRKSIQVFVANSAEEVVSIVEMIKGNNFKTIWTGWNHEPLQFPFVQFSPKIFPGQRYGHRIEGETIAETWVKIIHRIHKTGTLRPTGYGGQWQELIDLTAVITNEPEDYYFPDPNFLPIDRAFLDNYIPQILEDASDQDKTKSISFIDKAKEFLFKLFGVQYKSKIKYTYTYGQRLRSWFGRDQVQQVIQKLIGEIDAASAVMSLWDVKDHDRGGSPCLNHIWLRVVDNELSLTAIFRSNDMFSAWPANAMGLRALQKHIRDEIAKLSQYDLKMGPLIVMSESAHLYDHAFESIQKIINDNYSRIIRKERKRYMDAVGNYLIIVENKQILVSHTSPGSGEVVAEFKEQLPLKLLQQICAASPSINPEHSGYLGLELQKAFDCIKNNMTYIQDSPPKDKIKIAQANSINSAEDRWTVECPDCEHISEYQGFFDASESYSCEKCGCNFMVKQLWIDDESFIE